jgi:hypothetical protein
MISKGHGVCTTHLAASADRRDRRRSGGPRCIENRSYGPLDLLLLVNPAIDVASLLMAVHGHDLIADYQFGLRRGVATCWA